MGIEIFDDDYREDEFRLLREVKRRDLCAGKTKNECRKTRKIDEPYEVWQSADGAWEWRVLKKYQAPANEIKNPYARWLCAVKSPHTYGTFDIGDVYVDDIVLCAKRVK